MPLDLKGKQVEAFRDALVSAFPSWAALEEMVEFQLEIQLEKIVPRSGLEAAAYELIKWARSKSRLDDLLAAALKANSSNAALQRLAFELALSSDHVPSGKLEALVMADVPFANTAEWRKRMAVAERSICRFERRTGDRWDGLGTGFLVARDLVVTNAHVTDLLASTATARVQFDYAYDEHGNERPGRVVGLAASWLVERSGPEDLDYAVVRLAEAPGDDRIDGGSRGWLEVRARELAAATPLFILQHPNAQRLKVGVGEVKQLTTTPPRVHYTTNTEAGSSGSPCFTMGWELVALHQGHHGLNLGIPIAAMLAASSVLRGTRGPGHASGPPPMRIFMSYHRNGEEAALAKRLVDALAAEGHSVFLDTNMVIGTKWADEIYNHISSSDAFIVLISEESISREMVQREIREAYRQHRKCRRPLMLPIRVGYDGPLDYEMESYLGAHQYARWQDRGDDSAILDHLRRALSGTAQPIPDRVPATVAPATDVSAQRPMPTMDLRFVVGGAMSVRDPMYICRDGDREADRMAKSSGQTLIIKGARQRGKTSLLVRYLAACRAEGKRIALIDFQTLSGLDLETYPEFLSSLALAIMTALDIDGPEPTIRRQMDMNRFIQQKVLREAPRLVLAFDEVDRVGERPYKTDFYAMLRSWHNTRATSEAWEAMDLALVLSTEPSLLIQDAFQSPFNVGYPIELDCFSKAQCHELNRTCTPSRLTDDDVDDLFELLGGHPYLTRLAYHRVLGGSLTLPLDPTVASDPHGPFGDHLRAMLAKLAARKDLLPAMQKIIKTRTADPLLVHRLRSVGLVRTDGGVPAPANLLYTAFFRSAQ